MNIKECLAAVTEWVKVNCGTITISVFVAFMFVVLILALFNHKLNRENYILSDQIYTMRAEIDTMQKDDLEISKYAKDQITEVNKKYDNLRSTIVKIDETVVSNSEKIKSIMEFVGQKVEAQPVAVETPLVKDAPVAQPSPGATGGVVPKKGWKKILPWNWF
jgi:signal transduction histidine kinase